MTFNNDSDIPLRAQVLYHGANLTTGNRNKSYGEPTTNMMDIAWMWMTYLNGKYKHQSHMISGEDVAHMMTLMKIARSFSGVHHIDNFVDAATYQGIAAECNQVGSKVGETGSNDK